MKQTKKTIEKIKGYSGFTVIAIVNHVAVNTGWGGWRGEVQISILWNSCLEQKKKN